jgi:hypothetical protein
VPRQGRERAPFLPAKPQKPSRDGKRRKINRLAALCADEYDALSRPCRATLPRQAVEGKASGGAKGSLVSSTLSAIRFVFQIMNGFQNVGRGEGKRTP